MNQAVGAGKWIVVLWMAFFAGVVRADVLITEVMAHNQDGLEDQDGDSSDWIELYNSGDTPVNLQNWALTDDPVRMDRRWLFPSVQLPAGGFLVVFASGKDRRGEELHTHFRLDGEGEYLGLLDPQGAAVFAYAPALPQQYPGFSFGIVTGADSEVLIASNANARALVPTDSSLGLDWTGIGEPWDDQTWAAGNTGVGYERSSGYQDLIGLDVHDQMYNRNGSVFIRIPFQLENPARYEKLTLRMKYDDGFIAYLNGLEVASRNAPSTATWDSQADALHQDNEAVVFEEIEIPEERVRLQAGANVLAIQGLNYGTGSSDLIILPELIAAMMPADLDPTDLAYFSEPSPGQLNGTGGPPPIDPPVFSHVSGVFQDTFSLELSCSDPDAVIRYTETGEIPSETSPVYAAPIVINTTSRIRARVFKSGFQPSRTVSNGYIFLHPSVADFTSNIPLIVLTTYGRSLGDTRLTPATAVFIDQYDTSRVHIIDTPQFAGRAGLRIRGQTSQNFPKKQYALEIWAEGNSDTSTIDAGLTEDLAVSLLGMPRESDWVIQGPYSDKTLIRNYLTYNWSRDIGRYAPRTRLCEVFVNISGQPVSYPRDYVGVYVFMEKIKRDSNRVDIEKLTPANDAEPEITGGYIFKKDKPGAGDRPWTTSRNQEFRHVEPKADEISHVQQEYLEEYINNFESALYGPNFTDPEQGYAAFIDPDSFIDHWILVELAKNIDGFRLSTYYHKDRNDRLCMGPIWDYNLSLGNADYLNGWVTSGWYSSQLDDYAYPYWRRLFQDPDFDQLLADRWQELRQGVFSSERLLGAVDDAAEILGEAQARNFEKWRVLGVKLWPNQFVGQTWDEEIAWMRRWLELRVEWMDGQFVSPVTFNHSPGPVPQGFELALNAPAGTVYYTLDGSDPRLDGGGISPAARQYAGPITITESTRIRSRAVYRSRWSGVTEGDFLVPSGMLQITEIMYHPDDPPPGSPFSSEDFEFIELRNTGVMPLNLEGMRLTGGILFTFPNITLLPGEYILVVANVTAIASRYNTDKLLIAGEFDLHLANSGEDLRLEGPSGEIIMDFVYDDGWYPVTDGHGYSLTSRGPGEVSGDWSVSTAWSASDLAGGSPGATDAALASGVVVINEIVARTEEPSGPWIELLNTTPDAVDLGGWFLSDDSGSLMKFKIPTGTTISGNGFLLFHQMDGFGMAGHSGAVEPFALNGFGGSVFLTAAYPDGALRGYRESARYGPDFMETAFGRYVTTTGRADFLPMSIPTPGGANGLPRVGPIQLNEIMYHPAELEPIFPAPGFEYIELYNGSGARVILGDPVQSGNSWRIDGTVGYTFPPGFALPPYGYALVVDFHPETDPSALAMFRARYSVPMDIPILGPFYGSLDNREGVIQLAAPMPASSIDPGVGEDWFVFRQVEAVEYTDQSPWPATADGYGASLQRLFPGEYANDTINWMAGSPSSGEPNFYGLTLDGDGDQMFDDWEVRYGLDPDFADDAGYDSDDDGMSNLDEFYSRTDPLDPASVLRVEPILFTEKRIRIRFQAMGDVSYRVQFRPLVNVGSWSNLVTIESRPEPGLVEVTDETPIQPGQRFYRVVVDRPSW